MKKRAKSGDHRVINQFDEWKSVSEMRKIVIKVAEKMGYNPKIKSYKNPRIEREFHFYKPESKKLKKLGYKIYYKIIFSSFLTISIISCIFIEFLHINLKNNTVHSFLNGLQISNFK